MKDKRTIHQRLVATAREGRSMRLSAAEVRALAADDAIIACAEYDDEKDEAKRARVTAAVAAVVPSIGRRPPERQVLSYDALIGAAKVLIKTQRGPWHRQIPRPAGKGTADTARTLCGRTIRASVFGVQPGLTGPFCRKCEMYAAAIENAKSEEP